MRKKNQSQQPLNDFLFDPIFSKADMPDTNTDTNTTTQYCLQDQKIHVFSECSFFVLLR